MQVPWKAQRLGAGAIPGRGLLLPVEKWIQAMRGRRLWWEKPVEESQAARKQGVTAESCERGGAVTIASLSPHASIRS